MRIRLRLSPRCAPQEELATAQVESQADAEQTRLTKEVQQAIDARAAAERLRKEAKATAGRVTAAMATPFADGHDSAVIGASDITSDIKKPCEATVLESLRPVTGCGSIQRFPRNIKH